MARPQKNIDREQFRKLCTLQCTKSEIAAFFDVSEDTIERYCKREYGEGFAAVFEKESAPGKISLRRAQFELAKKNATLAIWLGKQYLKQRDIEMTAEQQGHEIVFKIVGDSGEHND